MVIPHHVINKKSCVDYSLLRKRICYQINSVTATTKKDSEKFMLYSVICVLPVCFRAKGTKFCQQYCIVKIQP